VTLQQTASVAGKVKEFVTTCILGGTLDATIAHTILALLHHDETDTEAETTVAGAAAAESTQEEELGSKLEPGEVDEQTATEEGEGDGAGGKKKKKERKPKKEKKEKKKDKQMK
jgi:hypothetical protein